MTPHQKLTAIFSEHHLPVVTLKLLREKEKQAVYYFELPGSEALARWGQLRNLVETSGYWPVLLGTSQDLKYYSASFRFHNEPKVVYGEGFVMHSPLSTNPLIHQSSASGLAWLDERKRQLQRNEGNPFPRGDWPGDATPFDTISSIYDHRTNELYPELYIALVPSKESWLVPIYLSFGDWNDCPPPDVHASVCKYWYDAYGAEVVALTHDKVEIRVSMPPMTRESALKLAEEQFVYCSDMEAGWTVDELAAQLLNASVWSFWWD